VEDSDTTGDGDAFSAGFIARRLKDMEEVACTKLAHRVAADFLRGKGEVIL